MPRRRCASHLSIAKKRFLFSLRVLSVRVHHFETPNDNTTNHPPFFRTTSGVFDNNRFREKTTGMSIKTKNNLTSLLKKTIIHTTETPLLTTPVATARDVQTFLLSRVARCFDEKNACLASNWQVFARNACDKTCSISVA